MAEYGLKSPSLARLRQPEKLVTLLLLFILLTAATAGVTSILLGPDWGSLWRGLTFGLLIGWVLAIFRQPAWRAGLISALTGAAYTLLFASGLRERLFALFNQLAFIMSRVAASPSDAQADWATMAHLLQELLAATGVILERVRIWTSALISGEPAFDPVAAAIVWSILVWIIAAWAGWIVEARRNALLASLPALLLSLAALSYGRRESATLYFMLGSILLLLATVQYDRHRQGWEKTEVAYPPRKGRQIGNVAAVVVVALVALSAILSSISLPRIAEWVSKWSGDAPQREGSLAKSLGIMAAATASPDVFEDVRRPGLPREMLIGSGPELSRRMVMTVEIENAPPVLKGKPLPLYWRSFTYDVYTGHGWQTSSTSINEFQSSQSMRSSEAPYHTLIRQIVRSVGANISILYAAGEPVSVNRPSDAAWRSTDDLFGVQINSIAGYSVRSLIPAVDKGVLRSAGQSYPGWVKQRFLYLPPEVPARVKDLAIQLTAAERTPYDRAKAIERYLRTIPYTLDVPYPPLDQDLVDFFLFDLRKGYCDYYASAMVVLARAAGVPARIAIGYASGTYDLNSRRFQVVEADAHSWVEVYFPKIGWVTFEPTAGRPALENPQNSEPAAAQDLTAGEDLPDVNRPGGIPDGRLIFLGGFLAAVIIGVASIVTDEIRLRRLPEPEAASEIYGRMRRYAAHLAAAGLGDTPYEFAALLSSRVQDLLYNGNKPVWTARLPAEISSLTDGIVLASYHPAPPQHRVDKTIVHQWKRLRWRLRLMWILQNYKSFQDRLSRIINHADRDQRAQAEREA